MPEDHEQYGRAAILKDGNIKSDFAHKPLRLIAGNCPGCGSVVAVVNHGQVWPLMTCYVCGWRGDTNAPASRVRLERVRLVLTRRPSHDRP